MTRTANARQRPRELLLTPLCRYPLRRDSYLPGTTLRSPHAIGVPVPAGAQVRPKRKDPAPQMGVDAKGGLHELKGLHQVIVGTRFESDALIDGLISFTVAAASLLQTLTESESSSLSERSNRLNASPETKAPPLSRRYWGRTRPWEAPAAAERGNRRSRMRSAARKRLSMRKPRQQLHTRRFRCAEPLQPKRRKRRSRSPLHRSRTAARRGRSG